jgi:hypothetical protein
VIPVTVSDLQSSVGGSWRHAWKGSGVATTILQGRQITVLLVLKTTVISRIIYE